MEVFGGIASAITSLTSHDVTYLCDSKSKKRLNEIKKEAQEKKKRQNELPHFGAEQIPIEI